jgi:hypothetical protein
MPTQKWHIVPGGYGARLWCIRGMYHSIPGQITATLYKYIDHEASR